MDENEGATSIEFDRNRWTYRYLCRRRQRNERHENCRPNWQTCGTRYMHWADLPVCHHFAGGPAAMTHRRLKLSAPCQPIILRRPHRSARLGPTQLLLLLPRQPARLGPTPTAAPAPAPTGTAGPDPTAAPAPAPTGTAGPDPTAAPAPAPTGTAGPDPTAAPCSRSDRHGWARPNCCSCSRSDRNLLGQVCVRSDAY